MRVERACVLLLCGGVVVVVVVCACVYIMKIFNS